jgi:hypothetical protein
VSNGFGISEIGCRRVVLRMLRKGFCEMFFCVLPHDLDKLYMRFQLINMPDSELRLQNSEESRKWMDI